MKQHAADAQSANDSSSADAADAMENVVATLGTRSHGET